MTMLITLFLIGVFSIYSHGEELKDELLLFEEIPIAVTASKMPQPITEAPGTISIITAQEIKESGARTLADVLRTVPGMEIRGRGNTIIVSARGFTESSNGVLYLMDGRIMNLNSGEAFDVGLPLPLTNIKQIEVIRGPVSSLYGANAFVGVVNIITKMPEDVDGMQVYAGRGSDDTQKYELLYGESKGKFGKLFTFRGYNTHGWQANVTNNSDDLEDIDFYGKILNEKTTFSFGYSNMERGTPGSLLTLATESRGKMEDGFAHLIHNIRLGEKIDLMTRAYINKWDSRGATEQRDGSVQHSATREELQAGEVQLNYQRNPRHMLIWGIDLRHSQQEDTDTMENSVTTKATYVENEFKVSDKLKITLGGRYDKESHLEEFNPRISSIYDYTQKTRLRMSYGEAFRSPDFSERFIDKDVSSRISIKGDPDLLPEKIKTYEVGLDHGFTDSLKGTINLFYSLSRDLITSEILPGSSPGTSIVQIINNKDKAESQGVEIELKNRFNSKLSGYANYTYQETEDKGTGEELIYAPNHKANLGIDIHVARSIILNTTTHYVGRRLSSSTSELGGYSTTDVKLTTKLNEDLEISFATYNVFDKGYEETLNYGMPGMTWMIETGYKF